METTTLEKPRTPFGLAVVEGSLRGLLMGAPAGALAFFIVAPFQDHTWPADPPSLGYGAIFGAVVGAVIGVGFGCAAELRRRDFRQVLRFFSGVVAPIVAAFVGVAVSQLVEGRWPEPGTTLERLAQWPRGVRPDAAIVVELAFAGAVLLAGASVEKGKSMKSSVLAGGAAFVGFATSGLIVRGEIALVLAVAAFGAAIGAIAFGAFWLTKPVARWLRVALKHD